MAKTDVAGRVEEMLSSYLEDNGLELYKVEYKKEGPSWVLRVYLDKAWTGSDLETDPQPDAIAEAGEPEDSGTSSEYVSIDECEAAAEYLSERLDEADFIDRSYNLEVSSPGLDRELIKQSDYVRFAGRQVEVRLYEAVNGSKMLEGSLIGRDQECVVIDAGGELRIPLEKISKINLAVIF